MSNHFYGHVSITWIQAWNEKRTGFIIARQLGWLKKGTMELTGCEGEIDKSVRERPWYKDDGKWNHGKT